MVDELLKAIKSKPMKNVDVHMALVEAVKTQVSPEIILLLLEANADPERFRTRLDESSVHHERGEVCFDPVCF